jgi:hypothetical protein
MFKPQNLFAVTNLCNIFEIHISTSLSNMCSLAQTPICRRSFVQVLEKSHQGFIHLVNFNKSQIFSAFSCLQRSPQTI